MSQFTLEAFEACLHDPTSICLRHRLGRVFQTYADVFLAWRKQDRAWLIQWTREYDEELEQLRQAMVARTEGEEAALVNRCVRKNRQRVRRMMRLLDPKDSLAHGDFGEDGQEEQERCDPASSFAWDPACVIKQSLIALVVSSKQIEGFYYPLEPARRKAHALAVRSTAYFLLRRHTQREDLVDWITAMYFQQGPYRFAYSMASIIATPAERAAVRRTIIRSWRGRGGLYRVACRRIRQLLLGSVNKGGPSTMRLKSYGVECFEASIQELCMDARQMIDAHYRAFAPTYAKIF